MEFFKTFKSIYYPSPQQLGVFTNLISKYYFVFSSLTSVAFSASFFFTLPFLSLIFFAVFFARLTFFMFSIRKSICFALSAIASAFFEPTPDEIIIAFAPLFFRVSRSSIFFAIDALTREDPLLSLTLHIILKTLK